MRCETERIRDNFEIESKIESVAAKLISGAAQKRRNEEDRLNRRKEKRKADKGAWGMPMALGGEEGRDKLRKAAVRGKYPPTRRCPNGETRRKRFRHSAKR